MCYVYELCLDKLMVKMYLYMYLLVHQIPYVC